MSLIKFFFTDFYYKIKSKTQYYDNFYHQFFLKSVIKYKRVEAYLKLFEKSFEEEDVLYTVKELTQINGIKFGTSFHVFKKKIKSPIKVFKINEDLKSVFYKVIVGKYKFIVETHFFLNKVVYFKYVFLSELDEEFMVGLLINKYIDKDLKNEITNKCIRDKNNACVYVERDFNFSINYLSCDFSFYQYLLKLNNECERKKTEFKNKEKITLVEYL